MPSTLRQSDGVSLALPHVNDPPSLPGRSEQACRVKQAASAFSIASRSKTPYDRKVVKLSSHSFRVSTGLAFLIMIGFLPSAMAQQTEAGILRVLSYNVHHGEGVDGEIDLRRIADVIRTAEPDLVALQEVDVRVERTGRVDQAATLARLTGMKLAFGANIDLQGGQYGNAILSRFDIIDHTNVKLPSVDNCEQRGVLGAQLRIPAHASPLRFLATHLDHRRDGRERIQSAKVINRLVQSDPNQLSLLAGDLNAEPDSEPLSELQKQWTNTAPMPLPTIPVAKPRRQIDYVLFRPADRWRVVEVRVLDEAVASDHRPILAVLETR